MNSGVEWRCVRLVVCPLVAMIAAVACGGDDSSEPEDQIARDIAAIEDAINSGDAQRLYDDFIPAACKSDLDREQAVENFEGQVQDARVTLSEPEPIKLIELEATVRIAFEARDGDDRATATDNVGLTFEDGHWRFSDCFGG